MARVFIDGFESGDFGLWTSGACAVATGITGMDGTYCLNLYTNNPVARKTLPEATEYYVAFKHRCVEGRWNAGHIISFFNGATRIAYLIAIEADAAFKAYAGATLLGTGGVFAINTTYLVEVRFKPHSSTGIFQVKINGFLVIDFSGNTAAIITTITGIYFGWVGDLYACNYIDNVIVDNAAWIGNTRIQAIKPAGAGNSTQWTPSVGANYACVDEVPPNETDYVQSNTVGHLDTYAAEDLAGTIGAVKCVQVQALAVAEGAPTPPDIQLAIRSGGTDYFSADKQVPTGSAQLSNLWETDPATAVPWTEGGVNALEIGVKAVA